MASLPTEADAGIHQEPLADYVLIRTADIDEGDRLRAIDKVWGEALGQMMARDGQDTAIKVCRLPGRTRWTLVAGAHRLFGARAEEIEYMKAEIVSADRDERRLHEVRENLWRKDLEPIDRAAFIAEAVSIYKRRAGIDPARSGSAIAADARWKRTVTEEADDATATIATAYGWSDEVGEQIGLSARTVRNDMILYRRLPPSLIARLREAAHPVLRNATQLRTLAKLDERAQEKVVDLLVWPGASLNYGQPKTVADAIAHPLGPNPAEPKKTRDQKSLAAFIGSFQRMTPMQQKGALEHLAKHLPKGTRIVDGAEPPAKPAFSAEHERYREEALAALDGAINLLDGLDEDDVVKDERAGEVTRAAGQLRVARFTIGGNGFELGGAA